MQAFGLSKHWQLILVCAPLPGGSVGCWGAADHVHVAAQGAAAVPESL